MDAWNAKMPIKDKICDKLLKAVQYLFVAILIETMMIMLFMLA